VGGSQKPGSKPWTLTEINYLFFMTDEQIAQFNSFYQLACDKMKGLIILEAYRPGGIGFFEKLRANKAIKCFNEALSIYPDHFQSLFFLGKLYQRLGNYEQALLCFDKALKLEQTNHNIPMEASLVAMHLNQVDKAIEYSKEAIMRKPDDFALLGNYSMNLLVAGLDNEAKEAIEKAILLNPDDDINQRIKGKIQAVRSGQVKRPTFIESLG
jgi:tetratricopeptide (TPR) repeat protein